MFPSRAACLIAAVLALPLTGCKTDERVITGSVPTSVEQRHPIGIVPERSQLDLNATGFGLSRPDKAIVQDFILAWREQGTGGLEVLAPVGTMNESQAASVVEEIKGIAVVYGMPTDSIHVIGYHTTYEVAPVRLVYERMVATLECGMWPTNVANNWRNVPYENLGCATQKNLAAIVEDPRDLMGPRPMTPRDAQRRDKVFSDYRKGEDPSTVYRDEQSGQISEVAQ